jgi:fibronectin-binding autotransporter adhesin
MKLRLYPFLHCTALVAFGATHLGSSASAQTTKADNTTNLNNSASWGSGVPTSSTLAVFDNTLTLASRTANLGGNVSVLGISATATPVSGATRQWSIGATSGSTLTIYDSGITKAANTSAFIISSAVTLGANQTWTLNAVTGTGTGNLQINGAFSDGGNTLAVNGAGILDLRASNTFGANVTIDANTNVNSSAAIVTFGGNNTFNQLFINSGKVSGATIGNFGEASNFGDGGTNTAILLGGSATNGFMEYTGNSVISNRTITRDARSVASGIDVSTSGQTLTINGSLSSGTQVNASTNGWAFGGAGNLSLGGIINNATGVASTGTTVTKNGAGTLTLSNAGNSYTGETKVTDGKLVVNGNISTSSLTSVALGATLGGTGTVGKTIVNGTLAVGSGPGVMTFTDTLGLNGATIMEIDGIDGAGVSNGHDFANLTGSGAAGVLTYGGAMTLDMGIIFGTGSYSWNLFDMASETGTFTTIALADKYSGSLFDEDLNGVWDLTSGDNTWQFTESTGVLGLTVIPEPNATILIGCLGMLGLLRRRRG